MNKVLGHMSIKLGQKILTATCLLMLAGCSSQSLFSDTPSLYAPSSELGLTGAGKIAMLVPLSGHAAETGEDLKQAGMMAQFDRPDAQTAVLFYDTQGTPEGAKQAYAKAMNEKPSMIIGPVFSAETKAIKQEGPAIPVLSFTSDTEAVGDNVYTMALLIPEQVKRIVSYACESGQRKIAVIGPENKAGELTMNTMAIEVQKCPGMEIQKVSLYDPKTVNFDPVVRKIVPTAVDVRNKNLTSRQKQLANTPIKDRIGFDSLFIFEEGVRLQQIMSLLAYYDVTPKAVPTYGLSSWQQMRDPAFVGGYFPAMPMKDYIDFVNRYQSNFGKTPTRLASMAYDAVSLSVLLNGAGGVSTAGLTQPLGFNGVDGRIRLNSDGSNTRLLDMMQMKAVGQASVVSPAPTELPVYAPRTFWQGEEPKAAYEVDRTEFHDFSSGH